MQTDSVYAFQVESEDYFVESGEHFQVIEVEDDADYLDFKVRELATDDTYTMTFAPFDTVTIVTSFEDGDDDADTA